MYALSERLRTLCAQVWKSPSEMAEYDRLIDGLFGPVSGKSGRRKPGSLRSRAAEFGVSPETIRKWDMRAGNVTDDRQARQANCERMRERGKLVNFGDVPMSRVAL